MVAICATLRKMALRRLPYYLHGDYKRDDELVGEMMEEQRETREA